MGSDDGGIDEACAVGCLTGRTNVVTPPTERGDDGQMDSVGVGTVGCLTGGMSVTALALRRG